MQNIGYNDGFSPYVPSLIWYQWESAIITTRITYFEKNHPFPPPFWTWKLWKLHILLKNHK